MHLLVALVAVGLVVLVLLLGDALGPEKALEVRAFGLDPAETTIFFFELAEFLDLEQVVASSADDRHELLVASGGRAGRRRSGLYFGQTYIYSAVLEHLIIRRVERINRAHWSMTAFPGPAAALRP